MSLPPENEDDNVEYKLKLMETSSDRLEKLKNQMRRRLYTGQGEAIYRIGVSDMGVIEGLDDLSYTKSIERLKFLAGKIDSKITPLYEERTHDGLKYGEFRVRLNLEHVIISIATCGNVNAGKSTFVGYFSGGCELDDGNGLARSKIANHAHEIKSGNTSSIAHEIVGFSGDDLVNEQLRKTHDTKPSWKKIIPLSRKLIKFQDLCGHRPYFKSTIKGINGGHPDYAFVFMSGVKGDLGPGTCDETVESFINGRSKKKQSDSVPMIDQHMILCQIYRIPMIIFVTKIDKGLEDEISLVIENAKLFVNRLDSKKRVIEIKNIADISAEIIQGIVDCRIVPIIKISCTTGENLDIAKEFMKILPPCKKINENSTETKFTIDGIFGPSGVGTVVSGFMISGEIKSGDTVLIGPIGTEYKSSTVRSIQILRMPADRTIAGDYSCLCVPDILRSELRSGMVVIKPTDPIVGYTTFRAKIQVQSKKTITIKKRYQSVFYSENIRQPCKLKSIEKIMRKTESETIIDENTSIGPGDIADVTLKMMIRPVNIAVNQRFIWSDGLINGAGYITELDESVVAVGKKLMKKIAKKENPRKPRKNNAVGQGKRSQPKEMGATSSINMDRSRRSNDSTGSRKIDTRKSSGDEKKSPK